VISAGAYEIVLVSEISIRKFAANMTDGPDQKGSRKDAKNVLRGRACVPRSAAPLQPTPKGRHLLLPAGLAAETIRT
jgi:hypothetical protein